MRVVSWSLVAVLAIAGIGGWLLLEQQQDTQIPAAMLAAHSNELLHDTDSPVGGNPNGSVTVVEFFDYNCPYCRQMVPVLMQLEAADPNLRIVYKEWPILGLSSIFPAKASLAANRQGKFIAFHTALYQLRGALDDAKVLAAAASLGLDMTRLKSDMQDASVDEALKRNFALARDLGIDGTPGFVIGRRILTGATDLTVLQAAIRDAGAGTASVN